MTTCASPIPRRVGPRRLTDPTVRALARLSDRNLELHAYVMDAERQAAAWHDTELTAWCALGRPLLRARQRRIDAALAMADGRQAA